MRRLLARTDRPTDRPTDRRTYLTENISLMLRSTDESGMPRMYSRWEKATPRKMEKGTISTQMMKLFHALASAGPAHSRTARLCGNTHRRHSSIHHHHYEEEETEERRGHAQGHYMRRTRMTG
jgi:hypothetical protein